MQPEQRQTAYTVAMWAALLIALAVLGRLVAHWPNFTPLVAVALFAGFMFRGWLAGAVPLAALLVSDLAIGFYPPGEMAFVYLGAALAVLVGRASLAPRATVLGYGAAMLGGAAVFFVLSNFGVWLFGGIYPPTWSGLAACYVAAIPFFKFTLAGTALWLAVLIGLQALAGRLAPGVAHRPHA